MTDPISVRWQRIADEARALRDETLAAQLHEARISGAVDPRWFQSTIVHAIESIERFAGELAMRARARGQ